jgi:hypothetical protein
VSTSGDHQLNFIKAVQSARDLPEDLANLFTEGAIQRIQMYQQSFIGRTIGNLADCLFGQVAAVFGVDALRSILVRYFVAEPPTAMLITDSVNQLGTFIRKSGSSPTHELFASLVEVSIGAWELIYGPDPDALSGPFSGDPRQSHLQPCSRLFLSHGNLDLYSAWVSTQHVTGDFDNFFKDPAVGLLLVKTGPLTATSIRVCSSISPVAVAMMQGASVFEAVANLSSEQSDAVDEQELKEFLDSIKEEGCLVNRRLCDHKPRGQAGPNMDTRSL